VIQLYICQFNQYFQLVAKLHQRRTVKPIKLFHQPLNRADDEMKYIDPFNPTGEWVRWIVKVYIELNSPFNLTLKVVGVVGWSIKASIKWTLYIRHSLYCSISQQYWPLNRGSSAIYLTCQLVYNIIVSHKWDESQLVLPLDTFISKFDFFGTLRNRYVIYNISHIHPFFNVSKMSNLLINVSERIILGPGAASLRVRQPP
jgi:hypothetical protein